MIAEKFHQETEYCTYCPKMCRFVCPTAIAESRETVTPTGRQTLLHLIQQGAAGLDKEALSVFHQCTGCGLCTEYCDHDIEIYPIMESVRSAAVASGVEIPEGQNVRDNYQQFGNPYGNLLPTYANKVGARLLQQAQILYVPDVTSLARSPSSLDSALTVLQYLEADNVAFWPGPELSSGYNLLSFGYTEDFKAHAQAFARTAEGAGTLVFASPHDAHTVRERYPEFGISIRARVLTEAEWLSERLDEIDIVPRKTRQVLYHDPCTLGRGLGQYEGPRRIIARVNGVAPLEFPWSGQESKCCGWGGGYAFAVPESAKDVARARIEEATELRPDEIVTASPSCAAQLGMAGGYNIPVYDLMTWLAMRLV